MERHINQSQTLQIIKLL